jgi:hypothetical protein
MILILKKFKSPLNFIQIIIKNHFMEMKHKYPLFHFKTLPDDK